MIIIITCLYIIVIMYGDLPGLHAELVEHLGCGEMGSTLMGPLQK